MRACSQGHPGSHRHLWAVLVGLLIGIASPTPSLAGSETNSPGPNAASPAVASTAEAGIEQGPAVVPSTSSPQRSQLELAKRQRAEGNREMAKRNLVTVLATDTDDEIHREALLELASLTQELGELPRAQQILAQYATRYSRHPSVVEVYLRQGEIYRTLGARRLAISKFYAVMTSALSLRMEQLEHYQKLVLQAQLEIAETYYLDARWEEATDFLTRLLNLESPHLDRELIRFKLIRALAMLEKSDRLIAEADRFIAEHPGSPNIAEVRFTTAKALMKLGRNSEALQHVLLLMESQLATAGGNPESWAYWQKRAGNEIGNQLYREEDYVGTLAIYERLAELDDSTAWQVPVLYQMGLVYERLQQPAKAGELYARIVGREAELGTNSTPSLKAVVNMSRWRKDHLVWLQNATVATMAVRQSEPVVTHPE